MRDKIVEWLYKQKWLSGHVSFRIPVLGNRVTIYGANAMWFSAEIKTRRWGYICFRPPFLPHHLFRWKFYVSPNGTPWAATYLIGGEYSSRERAAANMRRLVLGHNFNVDENRLELSYINGYSPHD